MTDVRGPQARGALAQGTPARHTRVPGAKPARFAATRRALGAASLAVGLAGCGIWPWSSSEPKLPELPPVSAAARATSAWTLSLGGGGAGFQPLVVGDTVFAAGRKGSVAAIDAASGRILWRTELDKPLIAGAGSDGQTTVVATRDGDLVALDDGGRQKWSVPVDAEVVTVPAVGMGLVLLRSSDNRVSAFDVASGKRRWTFDRQPPPLVLRQTSAIAMDPSTAYVGLPGGRLVALALQNGALKWEVAVGMPRGSNEIERIADVVGSPLISGGEVCAAAWRGRIACFDTATGRAVWGRELQAASGIDIGPRQVIVIEVGGDVQAFSRSGASLWRQEALRRREPSAPLLIGANVVVGDALGLVHVLSGSDGSLAARQSTDGSPIVGAPVAWGSLAIVQTSDGSLRAISVE